MTHNAMMLNASAEALTDDVSITHDELFDFIVKLDQGVGVWEFTDRLVTHFSALGKLHALERALDKANSERIDITDDQTKARIRS